MILAWGTIIDGEKGSNTYIDISEHSEKSRNSLEARDGSRVEAILKLGEGYEECNAHDTLLLPQCDEDVFMFVLHLR